MVERKTLVEYLTSPTEQWRVVITVNFTAPGFVGRLETFTGARTGTTGWEPAYVATADGPGEAYDALNAAVNSGPPTWPLRKEA